MSDEVATTADIQTVRDALGACESVIRADVRSKISHAMERQIRSMVSFNAAPAAIVLTAARLLF